MASPSFSPAPVPSSLVPNSPPQTPTLSPQSARQSGYKSRYLNPIARPFVPDASIHPVGNGPHFSYTPSLALPELSPRSSSPCPASSSEEEEEEGRRGEKRVDGEEMDKGNEADEHSPLAGAGRNPDHDDDDDDDDAEHDADDESCQDSTPSSDAAYSGPEEMEEGHFVAVTWIVEELSDVDPMESETERIALLKPYLIEDAAESVLAADSRYALPLGPDLDRKMMHNLRNLDFSSSISSDSDTAGAADDAAYQEFVRTQREMRMNKRRTQSMASIGSKRTLSELSDSDDREDLQPLDFNSAGSSARRMRRRTDRWSIQFQDPPPPRIDEQDEPDDGEVRIRIGKGGDNTWDRANLMQELPYCTLEIMEVDSG